MNKFIIAACMVFALAGCNRDYGECYSSHIVHVSDPLYMTTCSGSGSSMMCTPMLYGFNDYDVNQCDEWQYPNGDGPKSQK